MDSGSWKVDVSTDMLIALTYLEVTRRLGVHHQVADTKSCITKVSSELRKKLSGTLTMTSLYNTARGSFQTQQACVKK